MAINAAKLSRLSRNKTTGNLVILIVIFVGITFILSTLGTGLLSNVNKFAILAGFILSIFFSYIANRKLRQPFFIEISRYQEELVNRRFTVQHTIAQIELVEPLQTISTAKTILMQLNDVYIEMEEILNLTKKEISIGSPLINNPYIQKELKDIIKLLDQFLKEIRKKRENVVFLTNVRQIILKTINTQISRPRNEIESDYLMFKVRKHYQDRIIDYHLLQRILEHIMSQGEIVGRLEHNMVGELILAVEDCYEDETISKFPLDVSKQSEKYCVICRSSIESDTDNVVCPICQNTFHRNHLLEWLKVFNQCPICHERLTLFSNPS
ncbi:MAG: RING finger protein [Promethearchaeota archaeon]